MTDENVEMQIKLLLSNRQNIFLMNIMWYWTLLALVTDHLLAIQCITIISVLLFFSDGQDQVILLQNKLY